MTLRIKITNLENFMEDLSELNETLEFLRSKGVTEENPVHQELLERVIDSNIGILPEELETQHKSIGFVLWYNRGSFSSREVPYIYSNRVKAENALQSMRERDPSIDDNDYSIKELFA